MIDAVEARFIAILASGGPDAAVAGLDRLHSPTEWGLPISAGQTFLQSHCAVFRGALTGLRRCFEIGGIATPAIVASSSSDASSVFGFGDATATSRRIRALPEKLVLSARSVFSRAQVEPDADGSASTDMPLLAGLFGGDDV